MRPPVCGSRWPTANPTYFLPTSVLARRWGRPGSTRRRSTPSSGPCSSPDEADVHGYLADEYRALGRDQDAARARAVYEERREQRLRARGAAGDPGILPRVGAIVAIALVLMPGPGGDSAAGCRAGAADRGAGIRGGIARLGSGLRSCERRQRRKVSAGNDGLGRAVLRLQQRRLAGCVHRRRRIVRRRGGCEPGTPPALPESWQRQLRGRDGGLRHRASRIWHGRLRRRLRQ